MDPSKLELPPIKGELSLDLFPFLRVYKDGSLERIAGTEVVPAGLDPETDVLSKDTLLIPETGVSARLYRPNSIKPGQKLPLVVYFHGGGFFVASVAEPKYHKSLSKLVAEANVVAVSVDYRLAPESPLPAAYEDSWAALQWVAGGHEAWLKEHVDFDKVFMAGDSCGANMAHHLALKLKGSELAQKLKIQGMVMINPYFWGKDPIGMEVEDHMRKTLVDNWWLFVCPSDKGCDDPLINPFAEGSPSLEGLVCNKILVIVAEKDILMDRGKLYYKNLVKSAWPGTADIMEVKGEDHIFHIFNPDCENAKNLFKRVAAFINHA